MTEAVYVHEGAGHFHVVAGGGCVHPGSAVSRHLTDVTVDVLGCIAIFAGQA